jgi:hypothetical protein
LSLAPATSCSSLSHDSWKLQAVSAGRRSPQTFGQDF